MRILLCTASLDPAAGGPARSVPQLAAALADLGHEVGLWSPVPGPDILPDCTEQAAILRLSGSFPKAMAAFGQPDLVHDNGVWLPCHHEVARECERRKIPRVVSPRGMLEPWALNHKRWKKRLAWQLYQKRDLRSAQVLHATSDAELQQLRRLGLNQPAVLLPNGVTFPENWKSEIGNWTAEGGSQQSAVSPLISDLRSPTSGARTALFLSRLHPKKGLELLVEAWAEVRPAGWVMRVVGPDEGGYRQKIKDAVQRAGLGAIWTFEEMADGPAKWDRMVDADLFILPSFSENFGIAVAEALVASVPVITTTGTPWQGLCKHQCGWWVKPTARGIARALHESTSLPASELSEMGRRGAAWARQEFAWPFLAGQMAGVYAWIHSGGEPPKCLRRVG